MTGADDLLVGLEHALGQIEQILSGGRDRYEADALARLALQKLWINVGNYAEQYRSCAGLPEGAEPWTELYVYRCVLAHALPTELDEARVWHESIADVGRIRQAIDLEAP